MFVCTLHLSLGMWVAWGSKPLTYCDSLESRLHLTQPLNRNNMYPTNSNEFSPKVQYSNSTIMLVFFL